MILPPLSMALPIVGCMASFVVFCFGYPKMFWAVLFCYLAMELARRIGNRRR